MIFSKKFSGRLYLFLILLLCLVAAGYWLFSTYGKPNKLPVVMDSPAFALTDVEGATVTEEQYDNKVRLMTFIFTRCPDICPATTANMVLLQKELQEQGLFGDEVEFVSITFDPDNDTPEVLRQYAERMGINLSGWSLLRGDEAEVNNLASQYKLSIVKLEDGLYAHSTTSVLLIDGQQRVRKIYRMGEEMDNEAILKDIKALAKERQT